MSVGLGWAAGRCALVRCGELRCGAVQVRCRERAGALECVADALAVRRDQPRKSDMTEAGLARAQTTGGIGLVQPPLNG